MLGMQLNTFADSNVDAAGVVNIVARVVDVDNAEHDIATSDVDVNVCVDANAGVVNIVAVHYDYMTLAVHGLRYLRPFT